MSLSNVQYPATLTNLVIRRPRQSYITSAILPPVFSPNLTGRYPKVDTRDQNIRQVDTRRALGTAPNQAFNTEPEQVTITIDSFALGHRLPGEYQANEQNLYTEEQAILDLANRLDHDRELSWISAVSAALVAESLTTSITANSGIAWNLANSTPVTTLKKAIRDVELNCGTAPNTVCMSRAVADAIVLSSEYKGITVYTMRPSESFGSLDAMGRAIAELIGVERVLIGAGTVSGAKNTAGRGATPSKSTIWGANVLIGNFVAPSLECNSLGLAFYTNGVVTVDGASAMGQGMLVSRAVDVKSNVVDLSVFQYRKDAVTNVAAGWWLTDCVSVS